MFFLNDYFPEIVFLIKTENIVIKKNISTLFPCTIMYVIWSEFSVDNW